MMLKIDDREPKKVIEKFREFATTITIRMDEGDYVWRDKLIVERKLVDDFCGSIMDGRLKKQLSNMEKWEYKVVVIVGDIHHKQSKIHINCLLGALSSMIVKGVSVCFVGSDDEFVFLVKRLVERLEDLESSDFVVKTLGEI